MLESSREEFLSFKDELLLELHTDGLDPCRIYQYAKPHNSGGAESIRQQCIGCIAELLSEGIVFAGEFGGDVWDCTPEEAVSKVTREWLSQYPDSQPEYGAIVWLTVTERGLVRTSEAMARLHELRELDPEF